MNLIKTIPMHISKTTFLLSICLFFIFQLNAQNDNLLEWANQGTVKNQSFEAEIPFRYIDGYMFIDIVQNGKTFNFFFDTGAEATVIDNSIIDEFKFNSFAETNMSGPVITNQNVNTIVLSSILVSNIEFNNIGAVAVDLKFAKAKFCAELHGIIGSTLLKKAKWQIDYKNKIIKITNDISNFKLNDSTYTLKTELPSKGWGTEKIALNIDGEEYLFNFDTGNGRSKIVSHPRNFKKYIRQNKNSIVEYGFKKSETDYKFIAKRISIGEFELQDQVVSLENEVEKLQLLGNRFFENFLVTIDWEQHNVFLSTIENIIPDSLIGFQLEFQPNYETNKIEIASGLKDFTKAHKIEKDAILLQVNGIDVSNLSDLEFCDFWSTEWTKMLGVENLNVVISHNGKSKELVLSKKILI